MASPWLNRYSILFSILLWSVSMLVYLLWYFASVSQIIQRFWLFEEIAKKLDWLAFDAETSLRTNDQIIPDTEPIESGLPN